MVRFLYVLLAGTTIPCCVCGCANFFETRTITKFAEALETEDLSTLRSSTSDHFSRKALRLTESLDDFRILRLPTGETSIVKVEDVSNHEKSVTVEVGEQKRRLLYKLVRDPKTEKWVIDDIYMKQKKKGITAVKSVSEQMDLLLSVREFLSAWDEGGRADVLRVTTPEFGNQLERLPPGYLAELTRQVIGPVTNRSAAPPEAQMGEDAAVVRISRGSGKLVLSYRMESDAWRVQDVAVESRDPDDEIVSVERLTSIMFSALSFLDAYHAHDKQALAATCDEAFRQTLLPADLASVPLPDAQRLLSEFRVKDLGEHATFVLPAATGIVKVSLVRRNEDADADPDSSAEFLVTDVAIYDADGGQEKMLSAVFSAYAVMSLFAESLSHRDLVMARRLSTPELTAAVWNQADEEIFRRIALDGLSADPPSVIETRYRGQVTEIETHQGGMKITYVLRNWNGKLRVDDVWLSLPRRPKSLKTTWAILLPIHKFTVGLKTEQLDLLGRNSSDDFNRLVWKQVRTFPNVGVAIFQQLHHAPHAIYLEAESATVKLGDERTGAEFHMVREYDQWVVDDVLLHAGPDPSRRQGLKQALKLELARNFQQLSRIRPEAGTAPAPSAPPPSFQVHEPSGAAGVSETLHVIPAAQSEPPFE